MQPTADPRTASLHMTCRSSDVVTRKKLGTCRSSLRVGLFITEEEGDHAKRKQAALSSLPVPARRESDDLTTCSGRRELRVTNRSLSNESSSGCCDAASGGAGVCHQPRRIESSGNAAAHE